MAEQPQTSNQSRKRFSLIRDLGIWTLNFEYNLAHLKGLNGVTYIHHLLYHPDNPIHGLELDAKTSKFLTSQSGTDYLVDPETGLEVPVSHDSFIQARSLNLDNPYGPELARRVRELKAAMHDNLANETERLEAEEDYRELLSSMSQVGFSEPAERAARAVRKSIKRLYEELARSVDAEGQPHPVLRPFAEHLNRHIITPSSRLYVRRGRRGERGLPGRFIYQPPANVVWT